MNECLTTIIQFIYSQFGFRPISSTIAYVLCYINQIRYITYVPDLISNRKISQNFHSFLFPRSLFPATTQISEFEDFGFFSSQAYAICLFQQNRWFNWIEKAKKNNKISKKTVDASYLSSLGWIINPLSLVQWLLKMLAFYFVLCWTVVKHTSRLLCQKVI